MILNSVRRFATCRALLPLLLVSCAVPAVLLSTVAAFAQPPADPDHFEKQVRPLLAKHCFECHSTREGPDNGDLILDTVAGIAQGGTRGSLFNQDDWQKSLLWTVIQYRDLDLQMPPDGKLVEAEMQVIASWLKSGAVLPEYKPGIPRPQAGESLADRAARLWSIQPLQPVTPPRIQTDERALRPLDHFIIRQLDEHGLSLSDEADRRTLIRRLAFDLTGLPPTSAEIAEFLNDRQADAVERLVDRLLASPQYGERWARFWLDLARYTDTTASWLEGTGQAWLYRDWVVQAWNDNLPYDDFVKRQLAADFLDGRPDELAALGFLGLSPTYWKELKLAPAVIEQVVAEEWDERIDAVSRTFLGLTISCARCHDHKFDPISMQDYYGLAGVFASSQFANQPLLPHAEVKQYQAAHSRAKQLEAELKKIKDQQSAEAQALKDQLAELRATVSFFDAPTAHIVREASVYVVPDGADMTRLEYRENEPRDLAVFRRGNPSNPGDIVPRGFPAALSGGTRRPFDSGSGRLELAECMFDEAQALTARVIVNRIWLEHFGHGLVRTPSNFGMQGERPSHPELLDYLAGELIAHDWDMKWLHREIVLSATWRQQSTYNTDAMEIDPENRLLWRMNRRRLSVEMWRDSMLAVSESLDSRQGGPAQALEEPANQRRTLYALIARRELNQMLRLYDFPEPTAHSPRRANTITPLQQLYVLNAPFLDQQARRIFASLPDGALDQQISALYERLFARPAISSELTIGRRFLNSGESRDAVNTETWVAYIHALLGLNEFLFID